MALLLREVALDDGPALEARFELLEAVCVEAHLVMHVQIERQGVQYCLCGQNEGSALHVALVGPDALRSSLASRLGVKSSEMVTVEPSLSNHRSTLTCSGRAVVSSSNPRREHQTHLDAPHPD